MSVTIEDVAALVRGAAPALQHQIELSLQPVVDRVAELADAVARLDRRCADLEDEATRPTPPEPAQ